jgi:hypothetical protein
MSSSDIHFSTSSSGSNACYICMSSKDALIKPCQCKHAHKTCLYQWIETNHKNTCEICDQPYLESTNTATIHKKHIAEHEPDCYDCCIETITWTLLIITALIVLFLAHGFTYYDTNVLRLQIISYDQDFDNYKTTVCSSLNTSANCFDSDYLKNKCYHDSQKQNFCHEPHTKYCYDHCSDYVDRSQDQLDQQYKTFIGLMEYDTRNDDQSMFVIIILSLALSHIFILSLLIVAWSNGPLPEYNVNITLFQNRLNIIWYTLKLFCVIVLLEFITHLIGFGVEVFFEITTDYTIYPTMRSSYLGILGYLILSSIVVLFIGCWIKLPRTQVLY